MDDFFHIGQERQALDIVGWRGMQPVHIAAFFSRMDAWRRAIAPLSGENVALYLSDTLEFMAALFAALSGNRRVYLPANALPATCATLAREVQIFIGEFPETFQPLSLEPDVSENTEKSPGGDTFVFSLPVSSELVIYTSGSTGEAKAIPKRVTQLLSEVSALQKRFVPLIQNTDIVATVTHQHIYGLLFKVFLPLVGSMPIHASSSGFPEEILAIASDRRITLVSSPAHLQRFTENRQWQQHAGKIGTIFSSGGPLDRDAALKNRDITGAAPVEVYGSSETGGIAWRMRHEAKDDSWEPLPGVLWRIDPADQTLEVSSPWLDDTSWFRLADIAEGTDDNRFLLRGRTDFIVKIEEKRVSLTGIENALLFSDLVMSTRVIPVDMEKPGRQRLAAFIVLSPEGRRKMAQSGKLSMNRELRSLLATSFDRVAIPKIWRYLDGLPVNMQGKTSYAELKAVLDQEPEAEAFVHFPRDRLLEETKNRVLLQLDLPKNIFYFQGHFPETPILPGVVQLDWALAYARRYFALPGQFAGVSALKFQRVILPDSVIHLELDYEESKASLSFRYFSGEEPHASGRIVFQSPAEKAPDSVQ